MKLIFDIILFIRGGKMVVSKKALFITFEGADGCGKTTQLNKLNEYLNNQNIKTITTLEPGGCEIGKNLRQILLHHKGFVSDTAELFLYLLNISNMLLKAILQRKL